MSFSKNILACIGEIKKQYKNYQSSWSNFISLLVWPVISFFQTYFTYQSFDIGSLKKFDILSNQDFLIFLITGSLVFNSFWSMVQSAFVMTFERQNGTLETIFIAPVNKMFFLYGRSLGGLLTNVWLFTSFTLITLLLSTSINLKMFLLLLLAFFIILISSTIWGGFINALFLISRDSTFLFTLFDDPMNLFSGTTIPVKAFPLAGQLVSIIFPATYCLIVVRSIFLKKYLPFSQLFTLIFVLIILVTLTKIILYFIEKNNKKNGNLQLY